MHRFARWLEDYNRLHSKTEIRARLSLTRENDEMTKLTITARQTVIVKRYSRNYSECRLYTSFPCKTVVKIIRNSKQSCTCRVMPSINELARAWVIDHSPLHGNNLQVTSPTSIDVILNLLFQEFCQLLTYDAYLFSRGAADAAPVID